MPAARTEGDLRFLDPKVIATIDNLELLARFIVEGFMVGLHRSPYHGFSVEFSSYRKYTPGDDPRYVDWKVYGKTDRLYIKQFEENTNLACTLCVDLSGSMETRDMRAADGRPVDRLEAVRTVLDDFISRRSGDRIGLIFFGTAPFLQASFTLDHELVRELLAEAEVAMAGPQTMLGDAIGLAIKTFENSAAEQKVLVVLTDGNDTGSRVPPATAAEIAASEGLTIHTVAFGDPTSSGEGLFDARALEEIASASGGASFTADDREALEDVYRQLDEIEPLNFDTLSYRPVRPLYYWPLGAALALVLLYYAIMSVWMPLRRRAASHA